MFVATVEFIDAARTQSEALGSPALRRVFVAHPVQDRTDAELQALADSALEDVIAAVVA